MKKQGDKEEHNLSNSCKALRDKSKTLLLSTLGQASFPEISYAPYVVDDEGCFYIFISELAAHTKNLMAEPKVSVMFIANEGETQNIFARERLVFKCVAKEIAVDNVAYTEQLDKLEARFGNIVGMLRSLPDFHLFCLAPTLGHYVVGFGKAYQVDISTGTLKHISEEEVRKQRT